jgi:hypothetical protein
MEFRLQYDVALAARNLALALEVMPRTIESWDPGLWRGPRLLVPIAVEALVVENFSNGPWADVRLEVTPDGEGGANIHQPAPFASYENRPRGVHLHWALPDGLTSGQQVKTSPTEEPPRAEDIDQPPQPETLSIGKTTFPLIPDRWLVVRIQPGLSAASRRRATAWVLESEEDDPNLRVTPLHSWREDRSDADQGRWLTVVGKGDPAYTAYYDNVQGMLGFHDPLEGVASGPLTYLVIGWYSHPQDDPLYSPASQAAYNQKLNELRFSLGDEANTRLQDAAEKARERLQSVGLEATVLSPEAYRFVSFESLFAPRAATAVFGAQTSALSSAIAFTEGRMQIDRSVEIDPGITRLGLISGLRIGTYLNIFTRYWARQLLCHGLTYEVPWGNGGGRYNVGRVGVPHPASVEVAIGNTGLAALAAALADRSGQRDAEELLIGFQYGLLQQLDDPDGLAALEALLHAEDFDARPGEIAVDMIEEGDLLSVETPPLPRTPVDLDRKQIDQRGIGNAQINFAFEPAIMRARTDSISELTYRVLADKLDIEAPIKRKPRATVPFRRAMPRYWSPKDPVVMLIGAGRSAKHGEDGRFSPDGRLICRLTDETIKAIAPRFFFLNDPYHEAISARDLTASWVASGQVPYEVAQLFEEAVLLDTASAPVAAPILQGRLRTVGQTYTIDELINDFTWTQTAVLQRAFSNQIDEQTLAAFLNGDGTFPSPIAVRPWHQPWTPLHLDWEVAWYPSPNQARDWSLKEVDLEFSGQDRGLEAEPFIYRGRSLLTPGAAQTAAARVAKFLQDEQNNLSDLATPEQEQRLLGVRDALHNLDVLSTPLAGLHGLLIGNEEKLFFTRAEDDVPDVEHTATPVEVDRIFSSRAGHLRLTRLRVVDAFGQAVEIDPTQLNAPIRAEALITPGHADAITLAPRIVQPSRLMFRMLSAEDGGAEPREATKRISPVCGFILPDHLDEALEVYDAAGISQGQVQLRPGGTELEWQGVPGSPTPLGALPDLQNPHLAGMIAGLLTWGVRDAHAGETGTAPKESALSALLRMIDATLWTVDPVGREGNEHLSVLVGRPLAVVRAELRIDLLEAAVEDELLRAAFSVRLGAVNQLQDGLMGYYVNDDYTQFYPVHESIAAQTRAHRPREGFLGPIQTVPDYYLEYGDATAAIDPVDHPYINLTPVVRVRPGQRVPLTLIIDPRGAVHATSGVYPRKRIDLMREHVAAALDAIAVTFRIGPILTDPKTIRMPLPSEIRGAWSWVHRTGPTTWQESPIVNATDDAQLSGQPTHIQEGWLKLSGALAEPDADQT